MRLTDQQITQLGRLARPASLKPLPTTANPDPQWPDTPKADKESDDESDGDNGRLMYKHSTSANGLSPAMRAKVKKQRLNNNEGIKNVLSQLESMSRDKYYSNYKVNPNLLIPASGLMMMREKTPIEVVQ